MFPKWSPLLLAATLCAGAALSTPAHAGPGWMGVSTQSTDAELRAGLDLTKDGLLVSRVFADSPAERAGVRKGDVILRADNRAVTDPADLQEVVRSKRAGDVVQVELWRSGSSRTFQVRLGELPPDESDLYSEEPPTPGPTATPKAPKAPKAPGSKSYLYEETHPDSGDGEVKRRMIINGRELTQDEIDAKLKEMELEGFEGLDGLKRLKDLGDVSVWMDGMGDFSMVPGRGRLGVRTEKLTGDLAQALGVTATKGVLVVEVIEDTPAQKAGIRAGDVIVSVAGQEVLDSDQLAREVRSHEGEVAIVLVRKGARRTVQATLPERPQGLMWRRGPGTYSFGFPETRRAPRVYRWQGQDGGSTEALREEIRQLRKELDELRGQMGGSKK